MLMMALAHADGDQWLNINCLGSYLASAFHRRSSFKLELSSRPVVLAARSGKRPR
ncbi:hypothetical protein D3C71_2080670 [compost metagenome]